MNGDKYKLWTRRLLAFIVVVPTVYVLTVLSLEGVGAALTALIAGGMGVLGFYFGARFGSEKPE